jgi:hypothetical protein
MGAFYDWNSLKKAVIAKAWPSRGNTRNLCKPRSPPSSYILPHGTKLLGIYYYLSIFVVVLETPPL